MVISTRNTTKDKTARSLSAYSKKKKKVTEKRPAMEHLIGSKLNLQDVYNVDDGELDENAHDWLRPFSKNPSNHPFGHVPHRLTKIRGQLYVWTQNESYLVQGKCRAFPIVMVAKCKSNPTLRVATTSIQTQTEDFHDFEDIGLSWKPVANIPNVRILKSDGRQQPERGFVIPLIKPSAAEREEPKPVANVDVRYKDEDIVWSPEAETKKVCFEWVDVLKDASDEEKQGVERLLEDRKAQLEREAQNNLERKQEGYSQMVARIAESHAVDQNTVRTHLENMKIYKIYPAGLPKPTPTPFGDSGGVAVGTKINRFCDANGFFTS